MAHDRNQSPRGRQCARRCTAAALAGFALAFLTGPTAAGEVRPHPGGFWKCRPPSDVQGAFHNEDPVGLAGHSHVMTDCALHWSDGHGATYCFATPPSLLMFKDDPDAILAKAQAFWRLSHTPK